MPAQSALLRLLSIPFLLGLSAEAARAQDFQVPKLVELPPMVRVWHPDVVHLGDTLKIKRATLKTTFDSQAPTCTSFVVGSAKDKQCHQLQSDVNQHIAESNAYNQQARLALAAPHGGSPCQAPAGVPTGSFKVAPGAHIDQAACEVAYRNLVALEAKHDDFARQLALIEGWQKSSIRDDAEFEKMREEAKLDLAWEFIDHVPVSKLLDTAKALPALKGLDVEKIKAAYNASVSLLKFGKGLSATQSHEIAENMAESNRRLREAMLDLSGADQKTRDLLETISKVLDTGVVGAVAASHEMSRRDKLKTAMKVVEIWQPWWGLAVLGENLAERGGQFYYSSEALQSLHEAESREWNARRYYAAKLQAVDETLDREADLIVKYRAQ